MGRISPVFDSARELLVVQSEGGREVSRSDLMIEGLSPRLRVQKLTASGVDTLVCGAISRSLADMVSAAGVSVVPFVTGELAEVLQAHSDGRLTDPQFLMPGCRGRGQGRRGRFRGRRRGGRWDHV
jgi:predicted Fe-Mo cluster-binding NifX family protein